MRRRIISLVMILAVGFMISAATTSALAASPEAKKMVAEAKAVIKEISPQELKAKLDAKEAITIIDVRELCEWQAAFIPMSINIPRGLLEFKVDKKVADKNSPIVIYCRTGGRGALATKALQDLGYKNMVNLAGGFKAWVNAGYSINNRHGVFTMQPKAFEKKDGGGALDTRVMGGCP